MRRILPSATPASPTRRVQHEREQHLRVGEAGVVVEQPVRRHAEHRRAQLDRPDRRDHAAVARALARADAVILVLELLLFVG